MLPINKGQIGTLQKFGMGWNRNLKFVGAACNGLVMKGKNSVIGDTLEKQLFHAVEAQYVVCSGHILSLLLTAYVVPFQPVFGVKDQYESLQGLTSHQARWQCWISDQTNTLACKSSHGQTHALACKRHTCSPSTKPAAASMPPLLALVTMLVVV